MPATAKRQARYEDLFELPANMVGEIVNGELHVSPRPAMKHALAATYMSAGVIGHYGRGGGTGGWWIVFEPELHLGPDVLVPDLAGWRKERMPTYPDAPFTELAPDWICEVLSASTRSLDRIRKLPIYAREGVAHAWLVDPEDRFLEVFRLDNGLWKLVAQFEGEGMIRAEPFDAVELDMGAWWPPTPAPPPGDG